MFVSFVKKILGRGLRFGMLTVLTNIRSAKVLWLVEDNLRWKTTFGGKQPLVEDDLWWKMTFSGRQPSLEDNLLWEDNLWWRTPSV